MEQDHRIEPLAREVASCIMYPDRHWDELVEPWRNNCRRLAAFILDRESKRVGPLVEALDRAIQCAKCQYEMRTKEAPDSPPRSLFWELDTVLATCRALDAPPVPEPSLAEAVEAWFALRRDNSELSAAAEDAMRRALAREREKVKP